MKIITYTMPRCFNTYMIPISIQTCYIRNYCQNSDLSFSLPITECAYPRSFSSLSLSIQCNNGVALHIVTVSLHVFYDMPRSLHKKLCHINQNVIITGIIEGRSIHFSDLFSYFEDLSLIHDIPIDNTDFVHLAQSG